MKILNRISSIVLFPILILLSFSNSEAQTSDERISPRIVGGSEAARGAWPFMVGIFSKNSGSLSNSFFCGGSLVHPDWVLTAAHCLIDETASSIKIGISLHDLATDSGEIKNASRIIIHPSYNNNSLENDIALIELSSSSTTGTPILPYAGGNTFAGENGVAIGWGNTSEDGDISEKLRQVTLPIANNSSCGENSKKICSAGLPTGGKDTCQGDSGGPLVIGSGSSASLVGITSSGEGCARPYEYGISTRVSSYTSFINQYVPAIVYPETDGPFGLWNGFLGMANILELQNPTDSVVSARVNLIDSTGIIRSSTLVQVPAQDQFDVILNQLGGFSANAYGLIQVSSNVGGRISYYRPNSVRPSEFDFSYNVPLRTGITNTSYVSFNTFQPSTNVGQLLNVVANWATIVNLESSAKTFTVNKYNFDGALLTQAAYTLSARSRLDVDGGHVNPGRNNVGFLEIIPNDVHAKYLAQLIRYGSGGVDFEFAFPLEARAANTNVKYIPLGSSETSTTWIEIVNLSSSSGTNILKIYSQAGELLYNNSIVNSPRSQTHINASAYITGGSVGLAEITPTQAKPFLAQSMIYFTLQNGGIASLAGYQAIDSSAALRRGSYNLFLSMQGYLQIHNTLDTTSIVDVSIISQASSGSSFTESFAPRQSKLYLLNSNGFGTVPNSYGSILVSPRSGSSVFSVSSRIKREPSSSDIQYVNPGTLE